MKGEVENGNTITEKRNVTMDMERQDPLPITGGRPNPSVVAQQDKKPSSTSKPGSKPEKTRYSDDELMEFKAIILEKLDKAVSDYNQYKQAISGHGENDTNDTSPTFKVLEEGAATLSKEEAGKLAQRQQKFIQYLQAALVRIENKTYGICRETGKLIAKERLRAVPHATLSIDAKNNQK